MKKVSQTLVVLALSFMALSASAKTSLVKGALVHQIRDALSQNLGRKFQALQSEGAVIFSIEKIACATPVATDDSAYGRCRFLISASSTATGDSLDVKLQGAKSEDIARALQIFGIKGVQSGSELIRTAKSISCIVYGDKNVDTCIYKL